MIGDETSETTEQQKRRRRVWQAIELDTIKQLSETLIGMQKERNLNRNDRSKHGQRSKTERTGQSSCVIVKLYGVDGETDLEVIHDPVEFFGQ